MYRIISRFDLMSFGFSIILRLVWQVSAIPDDNNDTKHHHHHHHQSPNQNEQHNNQSVNEPTHITNNQEKKKTLSIDITPKSPAIKQIREETAERGSAETTEKEEQKVAATEPELKPEAAAAADPIPAVENPPIMIAPSSLVLPVAPRNNSLLSTKICVVPVETTLLIIFAVGYTCASMESLALGIHVPPRNLSTFCLVQDSGFGSTVLTPSPL